MSLDIMTPTNKAPEAKGTSQSNNYAIVESSGSQFWIEPNRYYDFDRINADIDTPELEKYLEDNLAKFKVPSTWEIIDAPLPRNASGKVMKHVLIDMNANNMIIEND